MGNILSKIKGYIRTKIDNTKSAIRTRVDNTKNAIHTKVNNTRTAIYTRVDNTRQAVVNRVNNTKNTICQKVVDTKVGIQNKIFAASDAVFSTVNGIKDGVVSKVTNTVAGIRNVKTRIVTKCTNARDSVVTKYVNTRNGIVCRYQRTRDGIVGRYRRTKTSIVTRYSDTKDYVRDKYRQARETKLTPYEKAKYSVYLVLILFVFIVSILTLWDVYQGNYDRASERLQTIWEFVCLALSNLWYYTLEAVKHILYGTRIFLEHLWFAIQVIASYAWIGTKIAADYTWQGIKIAAFYAAEGIKITWVYFREACKLILNYIGLGIKTSWNYFVFGAKLTGEYLWLGTKLATYYSVEGSKLAAEYTYKGAKYSLIHGSIALKNGTIKTIQWLFYFLTNFRAASKEAAIYLYETSLWAGAGALSGSYHGSIMLWDGSRYMAVKSYEGSISLGEWSVSTAAWLWQGLVEGVINATYCTQVGLTAVYDGIVFTVVTAYQWSVITVNTIVHCVVTSSNFLWTWSKYLVTTTSHGLYIGLNKYGLVWAYTAANKLSQLSYSLGAILTKFLTDLGMYIVNFVVVGVTHIYNLLYVVYSFVRQIFTGTTGLVKVSTGAMVYCVTTVFTGIIWVLEETLFAYMYMLHKYNMYREILFVGFIVTMCLYCTGLMRDRKRSLEERDGRASSSDSEDEGEDMTDARPRLVPRLKDLELPPYPTGPDQEVPSQDDEEIDEPPILTAARAVIKPAAEDFLPPTDDEDEFDFDHEVPDFMNLSGSEPEPEPPEDDEQDNQDHDLSFGTDDSAHEVPDIDEPENNADARDFQRPQDTSQIQETEPSTRNHLDTLDDLDLDLDQEADDEGDDEEITEALVERIDFIKRKK